MNVSRNDLCWCGSGKKYKKCHYELDQEIEKYRLQGHIVPTKNIIRTPEQIAGIKASCKINTAILDMVAENIKEGMSTEDIDK